MKPHELLPGFLKASVESGKTFRKHFVDGNHG